MKFFPKTKIGQHVIIPKGEKIWSINNQTNIFSDKDEIVEIIGVGNDMVFVKPKQLLFNMHGFIPTLIGRGIDEWSIEYSKTSPYKLPKLAGLREGVLVRTK